jgi:hypothetical protein
MTKETRHGLGAPAENPHRRTERAPSAERFPTLEARSLTGATVWLPADCRGAPSAVLVGFETWQQATMDSWLPTLEAQAARHPSLRVYELVPIPRFLLSARPTIDGGMAVGIPSEAVRARTLTAYVDLPPLLAALGLPDTGQSALFLVEADGSIRWGTRGGHDAAGAASLARALDGWSAARQGGRAAEERGAGTWRT